MSTLLLAVGAWESLGGKQIWVQLIAVGATIGYSLVASLIILWVVHKLVGLRVTKEQEVEGLDLSQHGEQAYN